MKTLLLLCSIAILRATVASLSAIDCGACRSQEECAYPKDVECRKLGRSLSCYKVYRNGKPFIMDCITDAMGQKMGGKEDECTELGNGDIFCMCSNYYCNLEPTEVDTFKSDTMFSLPLSNGASLIGVGFGLFVGVGALVVL